jgi:hypothetical protein
MTNSVFCKNLINRPNRKFSAKNELVFWQLGADKKSDNKMVPIEISPK